VNHHISQNTIGQITQNLSRIESDIQSAGDERIGLECRAGNDIRNYQSKKKNDFEYIVL